jgi:hypothetical protein
MSANSEGATGPIGRVALGIRFELFDSTGEYVGAFHREDVKGAAVPHSGELLARGTFSAVVNNLVGIGSPIDHVEHYLDVPQSKEWDPLVDRSPRGHRMVMVAMPSMLLERAGADLRPRGGAH